MKTIITAIIMEAAIVAIKFHHHCIMAETVREVSSTYTTTLYIAQRAMTARIAITVGNTSVPVSGWVLS